jgi:putative endonuclease
MYYVIPANAGIQKGVSKVMHSYYVYILASKRNGTLYIGVTNNLERRIFEHKNKTIKGFTEKYDVNIPVYYEWFTNIVEAIKREKQLKKWNRAWKLALIESRNPEWIDLSTVGYQFPVTEPGFPLSRE